MKAKKRHRLVRVWYKSVYPDGVVRWGWDCACGCDDGFSTGTYSTARDAGLPDGLR